MTQRVAVFGTSWWADAMYLPVLARRNEVTLSAVCGRNPERTAAVAEQWGFARAYTDAELLFSEQQLDVVIIATPNVTHHPLATAALEHGAAVLCEKPLALNYREAIDLQRRAEQANAVTLVPFTYRYMPTARLVHQLVAEGYLGDPYHLNLRYYSGWARDGDYSWRFNVDEAGTGILGDLGSHFLYLARWYFGEITEVSAMLGWLVPNRMRPDGTSYNQADDFAQINLAFANGAFGSVTASGMAHEPSEFQQRHEMEFHGSEGTLRHRIDWRGHQVVTGSRVGDEGEQELAIPANLLGDAPVSDVTATYRHVFRQQGRMIGDFLDAAASGSPLRPDFADGAAVQAVIDAAWRSHHERRVVTVAEVTADFD